MDWFFGSSRATKVPPATPLQIQRTKQIESLKASSPNVTELHHDVEYQVLFRTADLTLTLQVTLPPQFPQERPLVRVIPAVVHDWCNKHSIVVGCEGLNDFKVHSDLGKVVRDLLEEFQRHPPLLKDQQHWSKTNQTDNGKSPNGFSPYYTPSTQMSTTRPLIHSSTDSSCYQSLPSNSYYQSSPSSSDVPNYMPQVSLTFQELASLSLPELQGLLDDDDKLLEHLLSTPVLQQLSEHREKLSSQNEQIAKQNLEKKPIIEDHKKKLLDKVSATRGTDTIQVVPVKRARRPIIRSFCVQLLCTASCVQLLCTASVYSFMCTASVYSFMCTASVTLPPQFPQERPLVRVIPAVVHDWCNKHSIVVGCEGLNDFKVHSDLGKVVRDLLEEFQRHPPLLKDQQHWSKTNQTDNGKSPNGFSPYYTPSTQMSTTRPLIHSSTDSSCYQSLPSNSYYQSSPSSSDVPNYMPQVSLTFQELASLSLPELQGLLDDDDKLLEHLLSTPVLQQLSEHREKLSSQNEQIAKQNLEKKPIIEDHKKKLLDKIDTLTDLRWQFDADSQSQHERSRQYDPTTVQLRLRIATQEAEEESEGIAEEFLAGSLPIDKFLQSFMSKKKLCYMRKAKDEKIQQCDIVRPRYH
ncbi:PREDICTED: vacuolar protein sorting-associated protein 37A-like [Priapulus caudatus]|uniref:Vacuolar protein sorting-associated protein 37A-like n=1 Tax=Priapulus caudatus TaxID=37621 RepID=A0ABM1ECC0_PRICU|nr:PREDICTED: vacuolar protein sorting-associated protein 37A-like [Priapulus caudatus]